jgi:recombination protein RecA
MAPPKSIKKPLFIEEASPNEDIDFSAELIKQINKEAGNRIAFNLGTDDAPTNVKRWISTGSKQLDYIISNRRSGGIAEGRIVEIQGPASSGKSHIAYEIAKATQHMNGIVVYIDTENATSVENLETIGIDIRKRFVFIQETCIEEIFKIIESTIEKARNMKADVPVTVIWDSVAASAPKAEIEGEYDQNTIGLAARVLSKGFRKITHVIGDKNVCLVLLNQQRQKIGVLYGDPSCVSPDTKIKVRKRAAT